METSWYWTRSQAKSFITWWRQPSQTLPAMLTHPRRLCNQLRTPFLSLTSDGDLLGKVKMTNLLEDTLEGPWSLSLPMVISTIGMLGQGKQSTQSKNQVGLPWTLLIMLQTEEYLLWQVRTHMSTFMMSWLKSASQNLMLEAVLSQVIQIEFLRSNFIHRILTSLSVVDGTAPCKFMILGSSR